MTILLAKNGCIFVAFNATTHDFSLLYEKRVRLDSERSMRHVLHYVRAFARGNRLF